jgi:hypothetical protein
LHRAVPRRARAKNGLDRLEPVALGAGADALAHDAVEVDEDLAPQEFVELGLAGGVPGDELLERHGLIRVVVEDVEVWELHEPFGDPVNPRLEGDAFRGSVGRPQRVVDGTAVVLVDRSEQILKPVIAPVGVALEIEMDVAHRGFRQTAKTAVQAGLQHFIQRSR